MQTLNQSQFAKHIGVNRSRITQLKDAGRLVFAENGLVDVEASKRLIEQTADPKRDDVVERHAQNRATGDKKPEAGGLGNTQQEKVGMSLQNARAIKENYQARMAKLEYEKAIGELIPLQDAKIWAGDIGELVRSSLESLSGRLSAELAMRDSAYIRAHLIDVHTEILNNIAQKIEKGLTDAD